MKYLFYSHDGYGLGHTARNLAVAREVVRADASATVLLATGADDIARMGVPERVEILKLPSLRKVANQQYGPRKLQVSSHEIRSLRSRVLAGVVETFRPSVMLVDKHPFGAGGELRDALDRLRDHGGRAVLGLRDILDDRETVRAEWSGHQLPDRISDVYERVLVYGQQEVFDAVQEYGFSELLMQRTVYCGYVVDDVSAGGSERGVGVEGPSWLDWASRGEGNAVPWVVATVGGGEDGYPLLKSFMAASEGAGWRGVAVTGPMLDAGEFSRIRNEGDRVGVEVHRFVPRLQRWFHRAGALVCMGGYNTMTQALQSGVPMVCVPRVLPRREQQIRAEQFARLGLLKCVLPDELDGPLLGDAIESVLSTPRSAVVQRIRQKLRFNGGEVAALQLHQLAHSEGGCDSNRQEVLRAAWV